MFMPIIRLIDAVLLQVLFTRIFKVSVHVEKVIWDLGFYGLSLNLRSKVSDLEEKSPFEVFSPFAHAHWNPSDVLMTFW